MITTPHTARVHKKLPPNENDQFNELLRSACNLQQLDILTFDVFCCLGTGEPLEQQHEDLLYKGLHGSAVT